MFFAKQKALIALLFLSLPFVALLAFVDTPVVSSITMEFALKMARFRTGLRLEANNWDVRPLSFSAALNDVRVGLERIDFHAEEVWVQVSPLGLLLGRVDLKDIRIEHPVVYGHLPSKILSEKKGEKENSADWSKTDIPSWVGKQLNELMLHLKKRRITFERLRIENGKSEIRETPVGSMNLEISNLDGGQFRLEWAFKDFLWHQHFRRVAKFSGSVGLLRERKQQFFLAIRSLEAVLGEEAQVSLEGRWPGDFMLKADTKLEGVRKWIQESPWIAEHVSDLNMSGRVQLESEGRVSKKNALEMFRGHLSTQALSLDGYLPNDLRLNFAKTAQGWEVADFHLKLPRAPQSPEGGKLSSSKILIENNQLKGSVQFSKAGLCAILLATDVHECFVGIAVDGSAAVEGTLDPFFLKASPKFSGSEGEVVTDSYWEKKGGSPLLRFFPPQLEGDVLIEDKHLTLKDVMVRWGEGESQVIVNGPIVYKPTRLELSVRSKGIRFSEVFRNFLDLSVEGKTILEAQINYDKSISKELGRTRIRGQVHAEDFGVAGQVLGALSGPVEYFKNQLKIGRLKLSNGGGKAWIEGTLQQTPSGSYLKLQGDMDRLEMSVRSPESHNVFLHGFATGTAQLEGFTDYARHGEKFLQGPMKVKVDSLTAFGIPFESAQGDAFYRNRILELTSFRGKKSSGEVLVSGILHPDAGTELKFSSTPIPIKNIGWNDRLNAFQEGFLVVEDGYWAPSRGWKFRSRLETLKIAGRSLDDGALEFSGEQDQMRLALNLGNDLRIFGEWENHLNESDWKVFDAKIKDRGFYALFALLKRWQTEMPSSAQGDLAITWRPDRGSVHTHGLEVTGPRGVEGRSGTLLKIVGEQELSWEQGHLVKGRLEGSAPSPFVMSGEVGGDQVNWRGDIPAALVGLFLPTPDLRDGIFHVNGVLPLPPDYRSLNAQLSLENGVLFVPGIGQPLTAVKGNLSITEGRIQFSSLDGQMGGGSVRASGAYKIDFRRPGLFVDVHLNRAQSVILGDVLFEASGDLSIRGEQLPYTLSGNVLVTNALYTKEFTEKSDVLAETESEVALRYALGVELGNNCRVRNTAASGTVTGRMVVGGTDLKPEISGQLDILSGSIFAKDTEFRVSQGRVSFPGGESKVPVVNVLANTTIRQPSQEYRIQLHARGPADQMSIDLTSDPALPPGDIVNLLAFGVLRPTSDLDAARAEALQVLFGSFLGSNFSKATGVNVRFETASDLSQEKTIPKVTAVRKISDKVTATVGRSLNLNPETNVQIDYRLLNNVNLTGTWERRDESSQQEQSSTGVDLRFKFNLK